jgi:hypothetical protein
LLDRSPKVLAERARQRRSRARRKRGLLLIGIEVCELALIEALIRSGRVDADALLDRKRVIAEAAAILADFIARWPS